jgi:uncharacterized repeat protein (TIGR03837 family)
MRIAIFCRTIDNYGDVGVSWRLARALQHTWGAAVTFYLDRLEIMQKWYPALCFGEVIENTQIAPWAAALSSPTPDITLEMFGASLDENFIDHMTATKAPPFWANIEYLSSEDWVDGANGNKAAHPRTGLPKHTFIPGLHEKGAGLLIEDDFFARRDHFQNDINAENAWRAKNFLPLRDGRCKDISLFAYSHAPLERLYDAFKNVKTPFRIFVPEDLYPGLQLPSSVTLIRYPFLQQDDYDRLLWAMDANFVRGEDSLSRAVLAGRPLIWQPYAQENNFHEVKLAAFLQKYKENSGFLNLTTLEKSHALWNGAASFDATDLLHIVIDPAWRQAAKAVSDRIKAHNLSLLPNLRRAFDNRSTNL